MAAQRKIWPGNVVGKTRGREKEKEARKEQVAESAAKRATRRATPLTCLSNGHWTVTMRQLTSGRDPREDTSPWSAPAASPPAGTSCCRAAR